MHFRPFYDEEDYSFYDACAHIFPKDFCQVLLRRFNIAKLYLTGLVWQETLFGLVGIILGADQELENKQAIESFLRQASIALARRTTEERLSRSEQRFADLVTHDDRPSIVINNDGRTMHVNPRFTEIFGYTQKDIPTWGAWTDKACPGVLYQDRALAVIQPDQPGPGRGPDLILPVRCSNGKEIDAVIQPVFLSDGVLITIHPKRGDY